VSTTEELLARKISGSGLENREYGRRGLSRTMWHPLSAKVITNLVDKQRLLGRYSSLADSGHGVQFLYGKGQLWLCSGAIINSSSALCLSRLSVSVCVHFVCS
jgi:hypothetical protein